MASDITAMPFYIISTISNKILWEVRVVPNEGERVAMLLEGEVQAIEWDALRLYERAIRDEVPPVVGLIPVNTPYALVSQPNITSTKLTEKNRVAGVDMMGVRTFLLDHWLQGASKTRESTISDVLRAERLESKEVEAVVVSEPVITQLVRSGYSVLTSTQTTGLVVGTLAVLKSTDENLLKNVFLDYQQMLNQLGYIRRSPEKFLAKKMTNYNVDWLFYIPKTLYFSPQLFQEIHSWMQLNNPTAPTLSYEDLFLLMEENTREKEGI